MDVIIQESKLLEAAAKGTDAFLSAVHDAILEAVGGEVNGETLPLLSGEQTTLLAYFILREEVMDGGFIQLIHNGYGPFIFKNPLAKALKLWGLRDLSKLIYNAHTLYLKHHEAIERDCNEDEFMALFEQFPEFDDFDDEFVEQEEAWTEQIARYIDEHIDSFANIID